jgi:hypothetical protein
MEEIAVILNRSTINDHEENFNKWISSWRKPKEESDKLRRCLINGSLGRELNNVNWKRSRTQLCRCLGLCSNRKEDMHLGTVENVWRKEENSLRKSGWIIR